MTYRDIGKLIEASMCEINRALAVADDNNPAWRIVSKERMFLIRLAHELYEMKEVTIP